MVDKKPEWSDYAYDNDSISKRLGIEKDEVRRLKDEAATKSKKTVEGIVNPPGSVGAGIGGSIDINDLKKSYLRVGAKIPGLSVEFDTNGEGNIDIVNLIRVETIRIKCFYIQRFYLAGQFLYSDIQKVDSEECNDQQEDPPDPIPPDPPPREDDFPPPPKKIILPAGRGAVVLNEHGRGDGVRFEPGRPIIIIRDRLRTQVVAAEKVVGGIFGWKIKIYSETNGGHIVTDWLYDTRDYWVIQGYREPIIVRRAISLPDMFGWAYILIGNFDDIASYVDFLNTRPEHNEDDHNGPYQTYSSSYSLTVTVLQYEPPKEPLSPPFRGEDTKKMEKECCDKLDKLLKRLAKYQGLGQKIKPINVKDNKIEEKGNKDDNFPMNIPKRWIDREAKPKDDYEVQNMRHLILSVGIMLDRFEELFNPAGKDNGFPLKNPRDGKDYEASENDKEISEKKMKKKLKIETYLDLFRYYLETQIRITEAVGVDVLEFQKDEKNPIFHYLRWLKEYSEDKTPLDYQEWLTAKKKDEGLKASTTQFKSIPELILAELYNSKASEESLRARFLKREGMGVPNELFVPDGVGSTIVNDIPSILKKLVQILDLNTVSPFTAVLKDADPAKEGDQKMTKFYPDATSAFKEVIELLLENKVDSATRLNILIRQSVLATQQQVALLETLSIAYTIMYGLGLPYHQKGSSFVAPFDVSPDTPLDKDNKAKSGKTGKGKGFNPNDKEEEARVQSAMNSLNENREKATEKLLPDFLKTVEQEYLHTYFSDEKESLWYYIMSIFMKK